MQVNLAPNAAMPAEAAMRLIERDRELLDLLCANADRGLIFAASSRLPADARLSIVTLRNRGLVDFDRFLPSPSARADWRERQAEPAAAPPVPTPAAGRAAPEAERQRVFLAAIEEHGSQAAALRAIGLKATSNGIVRSWCRRDPGFKTAINDALARHKASKAESNIELQASGAEERSSPEAKPVLGVRPDSPPQPPKRTVKSGSVADASEIRTKPAVPGPTPAPPPSPAPTPSPARSLPAALPAAGQAAGAGGGPFSPSARDEEICKDVLRHRAELERMAELAPPMSPEDARDLLLRRGRRVHNMKVFGGSSLLWFCSGLGRDVTGQQLIAEAQKVCGL